jgi:predicted TIM-barrel fold metal-dependent hydrolase
MIVDARVRLPLDLRPDMDARPDDLSERYDEVLDLSARSRMDSAALEAVLDEQEVDVALVHAEYEFGDYADVLNEGVAELVNRNPQRYRGVGTVSQEAPIDALRAMAQVRQCADLGFVGISLQPAFFHVAINEPRLYPVYGRAAELGLAVFVHTGINYGTTHPFGNDHPMYLDEVACAFPGIKLVACHSGWPWTAEMVAVARKHPNVYLEFGGLAPKYIAAEGSGWEVMYRFMNSVLQDQVLYGTDWPAFDMARALEEWRIMGLKKAVREKLLGDNAARLFSL